MDKITHINLLVLFLLPALPPSLPPLPAQQEIVPNVHSLLFPLTLSPAALLPHSTLHKQTNNLKLAGEKKR